MGPDKRTLAALAVLAAFILLVVFTSLYFEKNLPQHTCGCIAYTPYVIPIFASFGIMIGGAVYYFVTPKLETRKKLQLISRFLPDDERLVISTLLSQDCICTQAKLSRKTGLTRLKVHRIVKKMLKKGIVGIEKDGKVNIIKLKL